MIDWVKKIIEGKKGKKLRQDKQAIREELEKAIKKSGITLDGVKTLKPIIPQLLANSIVSIRKFISTNGVDKATMEQVVYEYFLEKDVDVSEGLDTLNSRTNRSHSEHTAQGNE